MRLAAALAWSVLVMLVGICPGHAEKRVALVMGNATYQNTPQLGNAVNDAEDVAVALLKVGFTVILERNLTKRGMEGALGQFARQAQDADTALVYYAGHGMQYAGVNYLMPVDAKLEDEFSVNFELTRIDDVLFALGRVRGVKMLVLDACRNNPLTERLSQREATRAFAPTRGLARIEAGRGMVIAYSTQPNQVAVDGKGRNSPFAQAFMTEIAVPGLEITTLFRRVALAVNRETGGKQLPELSMSLLEEFYLNTRESDLQAWGRIRNTSDAAVLRDFITQYPESMFVGVARQQLATIEREPADRLAREKAEQARLEAERLAAEKAAAEAARAKAAQQRLEAERLANEKAAAEAARRKAEQQRLEAERLANEKAAAEARRLAEQERERVAREQAAREDREKARESQKASEQASQPQPADPAAHLQTALLTPQVQPAPPEATLSPPLAGAALVREIKKELKRVGCHAGPVDEAWDNTRPSLVRFAKYASVAVPDSPTYQFLERLRGLSSRLCPIECGSGRIEQHGKCVVKPSVQKKPETRAAARSNNAQPAQPEAATPAGPKNLDKIIAIQNQCAAEASVAGYVGHAGVRRHVRQAVRCTRSRGGYM